jgi:hypothetical protein
VCALHSYSRDLLSPEFTADPYGHFETLRRPRPGPSERTSRGLAAHSLRRYQRCHARSASVVGPRAAVARLDEGQHHESLLSSTRVKPSGYT